MTRRLTARGFRAAAVAAVASAALGGGAGAVNAQSCGNDGAGFERWMQGFKGRAAAHGLRPATIEQTLSGVQYDAGVIRLDRGQRSFKLSFEQFYARRVSSTLLSNARRRIDQHRALLDRIEKRFGVPPEILVSIWGLETNFGADGAGGKSIFQSLATLAYDCRRAAFFENELVNAIRIVDRGDKSTAEMRGGWAGEIGQVQFLPSSYVKYAVDFDGDGRRDLMRSVPDMLASTANYLQQFGWRAGQDWMPGSANYDVIKQWNKADVYARTIATMASRLRNGG